MEIRGFGPPDYGPYGRIHDALFPAQPFFPERVKYEDSCFGRTRYRMKRYVAEAESEVAAVGGFNHLFWSYHPKRFSLSLEVHPRWQRRGIGGALYDRLISELRGIGAEAAWVELPSDSAAGRKFVEDRGFVERRTTFESVLDLASVNPWWLRETEEDLTDQGITIADLSTEMKNDPHAGRKLFDSEGSAGQDVPNIVEAEGIGYHDYEIITLKNPLYVWQGSFVAKLGDEYVGSSSLFRAGRNDTMYQGFTAVRPEFRGRGIAQAVKVRVARYAREAGARFLRTGNDSRNKPMLAVNWKLGFVKKAEWITFEKSL